MGRHTHPDDIDEEPARPGPPAVEPNRPNKTSAVADLQLILRSPRLLGTCVAAVVAPFILYLVVILIAGRTADWALFIGAPMVAAGVLVGATLDRAYSRLDHGGPGAAAGPAVTVEPTAAFDSAGTPEPVVGFEPAATFEPASTSEPAPADVKEAVTAVPAR